MNFFISFCKHGQEMWCGTVFIFQPLFFIDFLLYWLLMCVYSIVNYLVLMCKKKVLDSSILECLFCINYYFSCGESKKKIKVINIKV